MRRIKTQNGYTMVETLIVVAVTGMLFVSTSLLISGQVGRTQFRQSMVMLEQNIDNIIDNVNNGTFGNISPYDGTSNNLRIGTRFWFCVDGAVHASIPGCNPAPDGSSSIMHVETVVNDGSIKFLGDNPVTLPNGLMFKGWKYVGNSGLSTEFGTSLVFVDPTGAVVDSVDDNIGGIRMLNRGATLPLTNTVLLCFEDGGGRWGSIELGSQTGGTSTKVNLEDKTRCTT